ncbi:MAG: hypothetical protein ACMG6E_06895, partial [Candidatus Roizmanbacteria bacterium]
MQVKAAVAIYVFVSDALKLKISLLKLILQMTELFIPPTREMYEHTADQFATTVQAVKDAMQFHKIYDNHTLLMKTYNKKTKMLTSKSGIKMKVELRDGGYINSDPDVEIVDDEQGGYTVEAIILLNDRQTDDFHASLRMVPKVSSKPKSKPKPECLTLQASFPLAQL